jgi:hypothetical protein
MALKVLKAKKFEGKVTWGSDSTYALGVIMQSLAISTEAGLVENARHEAHEAKKRYGKFRVFTRRRTLGFLLMRQQMQWQKWAESNFRIQNRVQLLLEDLPTVFPSVSCKHVFLIEHALWWSCVDQQQDCGLVDSKGQQGQFLTLTCATANVLTLHPRDCQEDLDNDKAYVDSYRRIELATQFRAMSLGIVDIQETRLKQARAKWGGRL